MHYAELNYYSSVIRYLIDNNKLVVDSIHEANNNFDIPVLCYVDNFIAFYFSLLYTSLI